MEYTSDSDLSDDTRELVSRGLASVRRKRRMPTTQSDDVHERFLVSNMDTSSVRHPSRRGVSFGDTSIHGLAVADVETANSQNHNIVRFGHLLSIAVGNMRTSLIIQEVS